MSSSTTNSHFLTEEERKKLLDSIIAFFLDERDEEIGLVAATNVLDFIEAEVAPTIYNRAVEDVSTSLKEHFEEVQFKLQELKK